MLMANTSGLLARKSSPSNVYTLSSGNFSLLTCVRTMSSMTVPSTGRPADWGGKILLLNENKHRSWYTNTELSRWSVRRGEKMLVDSYDCEGPYHHVRLIVDPYQGELLNPGTVQHRCGLCKPIRSSPKNFLAVQTEPHLQPWSL